MSLAVATLVIALVALVLAAISLSLALRVNGRVSMTPVMTQGASNHPYRSVEEPAVEPHTIDVWVIYNPTKITLESRAPFNDIDQFIDHMTASAENAGYAKPTFIATTEEDNGAGMAKQALAAKAKLIICAGGDGTVRNVAGVLSQTGVPMGIVPLGTGNLLAMNLGMPVDRIDQCIELAFTGRFRTIDMGFASINGKEERYPFTVIAGMGFDGEIMATTGDRLKQSLGKTAYVISGVRASIRRPMTIDLQIGSAPPRKNIRALTLLFANCGMLSRDVPLLPKADPADGWLDVARLDIRAGVIGWLEFIIKVMIRSTGLANHVTMVNASLDVLRARSASVTSDIPRHAQVDGDALGKVQSMSVTTVPNALIVHC